jgi:hypothetical protein
VASVAGFGYLKGTWVDIDKVRHGKVGFCPTW